MDSAYQDDATRELGFVSVVMSSPQRRQPWALDKAVYREPNEVERLSGRLKAWRRVFPRYDKTDIPFAAFTTSTLIAEALRENKQTLVETGASSSDLAKHCFFDLVLIRLP